MNPHRNAINRWARDAGYSDFDAYVQAGGSILDARRDIAQRIQSLQHALDQIQRFKHTPTEADPIEPHNAQIQGAEHSQ